MFSTRSFENTQPFLFAGYFLPIKVLFLPLAKLYLQFISQLIKCMYVKENLEEAYENYS